MSCQLKEFGNLEQILPAFDARDTGDMRSKKPIEHKVGKPLSVPDKGSSLAPKDFKTLFAVIRKVGGASAATRGVGLQQLRPGGHKGF
jgi:hypothetical protein